MEFFNILMHNDIKDSVILIFANKMDLPTAKNAAEISDIYGFHEIKHHDWHIQGCCAITGEGLNEGLDWLTSKLAQKNKIHRVENNSSLIGVSQKNVTRLPDHEKKAKLTDLTIGDKEDVEINMSNRSMNMRVKGVYGKDEEEKV